MPGDRLLRFRGRGVGRSLPGTRDPARGRQNGRARGAPLRRGVRDRVHGEDSPERGGAAAGAREPGRGACREAVAGPVKISSGPGVPPPLRRPQNSLYIEVWFTGWGHDPVVPRTRSSNQNCRESDCELRVQSGTTIIELLVSYDSEVRYGACGKVGRTSESGH